MTEAKPFPADGYQATWWTSTPTSSPADECGEHDECGDTIAESVDVRWDNEAWTATGTLHAAQVQYVMRISPFWELRQLLLFRDMDEPDLWLGTDGRGRWGEINGAHRPELDGARDAMVLNSQFGWTPPIRRLPLPAGDEMTLPMLVIDPETLGVTTRQVRLGHRRDGGWSIDTTNVDVDEYGVVGDVPGRFRRVT